MSEPKSSFLDPKTLMAIMLLGLSWMGWQWYMTQKYPDYYAPAPVESDENQETSDQELKPETDRRQVYQESELREEVAVRTDEFSEPADLPETLLAYSDEQWSFAISSKGMGIKDLQLNKYTDRENKSIRFLELADGSLPFETSLIGQRQPLHFHVEKMGANRFLGRAQFRGLTITKTMEVVSEKFSIETHVQVSGLSDSFIGLSTLIPHRLQAGEKPSFFMPFLGRQEFFILAAGSENRVLVHEDESVNENYSRVTTAAVGTQYFAQAFVDRSDVMPEFRAIVEPQRGQARGIINHLVLNKGEDFNINYTSFMGPKYLDVLQSIDAGLSGVVDLGWFSWLARPILRLMKWFYSIFGNWGIAIIILTIVVRILVLPFNMMSYRSMKGMQLIQPQVKALREKFKEDPTRLNQEMMSLFKTNKINPIGGCLPMLLQFPVFIALYQVLAQSIELYQAPFTLWIQDLSMKDPFFVLPALMAVTMFVQFRVTPTTMDPAQAKIMMFMPIIFSLFMISFPSGLVLYIFISSLFGLFQQMYFMKTIKHEMEVKS